MATSFESEDSYWLRLEFEQAKQQAAAKRKKHLLQELLVPAFLMGSAIKTYRTMAREPGDVRVLMGGLAPGTLYFFVIFIPYSIAVPPGAIP